MFLKRTKGKMKQRLCTGYNPGQKGLGHCSYPPPPLFGRKLVSDRQSTVVNMAMPGFPPPPLPPLNKVEVHTLTRFFKSVWPVTPNTVQGGGGL